MDVSSDWDGDVAEDRRREGEEVNTRMTYIFSLGVAL